MDIREANKAGVGQILLDEKRRCGCRLDAVGPLDQDVFIQYCDLHRMAPRMLQVLEEVVRAKLSHKSGGDFGMVFDEFDAAIELKRTGHWAVDERAIDCVEALVQELTKKV